VTSAATMDEQPPARRGFLLYAALSYLPPILSVISGPILARGLGPGLRGQYAAVQAYDEVSSTVFRVGLPEAAAYYTKENPAAAPSIVASVLRVGLVMTPVAAVTAALLVFGPLRDLTPTARTIAFVVVLWSPLVNTVSYTFRNIFVARGDFVRLALLTAWAPAVLFLSTIVFWLVGRLTLSYAVAALGIAAATSLVFSGAMLRIRPSGGFGARKLMSYGIRATPAALASLVNVRLDQVLIAPLLGSEKLGQYAVAVNFATVPMYAGLALSFRAFSTVKNGDLNQVGHVVRQALLVCGLASVAVTASAPLVIPVVFGNPYRAAVLPAMVLGPGMIALCCFLVGGQCAYALGRPGVGSAGQVAGLIISVIGFPFALAFWGITGAALVSSLSYTVSMIVVLVWLRKQGMRGLGDRAAWRHTVSSLRRAGRADRSP
jgi:O-antigen/teichoic acid export membrane protein